MAFLKAADELRFTMAPVAPTYSRIYRDFRAVVQSASCSEAKRWLKLQRYKYNIRSGSAIRRTLDKAASHHSLLFTILRKPRAKQWVACPQASVQGHFRAYFNRPCSPPVLDEDFLRDFRQLPPCTQQRLDVQQFPITVQELRLTVNDMNSRAAPGAFGIEIGLLKVLLCHDLLALTTAAAL